MAIIQLPDLGDFSPEERAAYEAVHVKRVRCVQCKYYHCYGPNVSSGANSAHRCIKFPPTRQRLDTVTGESDWYDAMTQNWLDNRLDACTPCAEINEEGKCQLYKRAITSYICPIILRKWKHLYGQQTAHIILTILGILSILTAIAFFVTWIVTGDPNHHN